MTVFYRVRCQLHPEHDRDASCPDESMPLTLVTLCSGCKPEVEHPLDLMRLVKPLTWRIDIQVDLYIERRKREVGAKYGVTGEDYAGTSA